MKSYLTLLLIALGGAVGSLTRYGLGGWVQGSRLGFPVGTLVVNLLGCLLMGILGRWVEVGVARSELRLLLGVGFLGGFTTFSAFSLETLRLYLNHSPGWALLYLAASVVGCLAAVTVGYLAARALWT
jgi:fluoride exporter